MQKNMSKKPFLSIWILVQDELVTPNSLCFSNNGRRLFCGYNKTIRIFYTDRPGKDCDVIPTKSKTFPSPTGIDGGGGGGTRGSWLPLLIGE